jgi:hypothetical protein
MTRVDTLPEQGAPHNRRRNVRSDFEQEVRYVTLDGNKQTGVGMTVNISSGGVCFTTQSLLPVGTSVELSMNWPALMRDSSPIKLIIYGRVIRSGENKVVVTVGGHTFRKRETCADGRVTSQLAAREGSLVAG